MLARLASARTGGMLALGAAVALAPLAFANNYHYEIAILVGLNAVVCVGLNLLIGYAGQISLSAVVLEAPYGSLTTTTCLLILTALAAVLFLLIRPLLDRKLA